MSRVDDAPPADMKSGFAAREIATAVLLDILRRSQPLDDALAAAYAGKAGARLTARDRAFARLIVTTVLRRHGELTAVLASFLSKPLSEKTGRAETVLLVGAAQLLFLDTPPHAAISLAVEAMRHDKRTTHLAGLANAVLRAVAREGRERLATAGGLATNVPDWMRGRWAAAYGSETAGRIAEASLAEPALDVTVKADPSLWAERLGGWVLPTGSVRLAGRGVIEELPGYADGAWWVQDAAAALPARLLRDLEGRSVADLCAAPGGKTAQLAAAGARVTAVESRAARLARLKENLDRLKLKADLVTADATAWSPGAPFDAVLLDAPCTATGTIRRHPDILHLERSGDLATMTALQAALLDNAARLVRPGGSLVYCTCSLEPEEGEAQIAGLLTRHPDFAREPVGPAELGIEPGAVTAAGDLRTLPFHLAAEGDRPGGLDGFYAARLRRNG